MNTSPTAPQTASSDPLRTQRVDEAVVAQYIHDSAVTTDESGPDQRS
jgi:hypothetical protein